MRKTLLVVICSFIAGCLLQAEDRPNIILIVSDDHGREACGWLGNDVVKTPQLDRLAESSVSFLNAFCTSASCSASRSVILTGKFGHATGHYGHAHSYHHFSTYDTVKSLPVMLEESGYRTARVGKYHLAPEPVYHFEQTFEADPRNTVEMAEKCRELIESSNEAPFFLYFCPDDPHRGYPFKSDPWNVPNSFGNKPEGYEGVEKTEFEGSEVLMPDFLPESEETRAELAEYYESVSRLDQGVGRLLEILKKARKFEDSLIVYISDNGVAFPGAKTTVYEPGIRLPMLLKMPGGKWGGQECDAMVSWVDLTPSLLDIAGVQPQGLKFHGRSFAKVAGEESVEGWDTVYASHTFHEITMYYPMRVVRERQYKLIWNLAYEQSYPFADDLWHAPTWQGVHRRGERFFGKRTVEDYLKRSEFELYDLEEDPDEAHNLVDSFEHQEVLTRLKKRLKALQMETEDPWIIKWGNENIFGGTGVGL